MSFIGRTPWSVRFGRTRVDRSNQQVRTASALPDPTKSAQGINLLTVKALSTVDGQVINEPVIVFIHRPIKGVGMVFAGFVPHRVSAQVLAGSAVQRKDR